MFVVDVGVVIVAVVDVGVVIVAVVVVDVDMAVASLPDPVSDSWCCDSVLLILAVVVVVDGSC